MDSGFTKTNEPQREVGAEVKRKRFFRSIPGATAVEYALMASLIAGVIAATVIVLGGAVRDLFSRVVF